MRPSKSLANGAASHLDAPGSKEELARQEREAKEKKRRDDAKAESRVEALENLDVPGGVAACFPGLLFGNGEKIRVYRHARQSFTLKIGVQYLFPYIALMRHKRKPLSTSEGLKLRAN